MHDKGIQVMDHPAYSPDLNPIENIWRDLEERVEKHNCMNVDDLQTTVENEWRATSVDLCRRVIADMKTRCELIIRLKGSKINK